MNNRQRDTGRFWKRAIAGLFVLFCAAMVMSFGIAARKVSRVVDKDYYSHGLHYGESRNRADEAAAGWSMTATLAGGRLQLRVRDASGAPLGGGMVLFDMEPNGSGKKATLILVETAPGTYLAPQPAGAWSELRGTMRVTRGAAAIHEKMVFFN
ncbi:MAG: FixH family protein [Deltaproteobacteria bacterium]|nr:FixH family protein [Deltaproteobacteria bacterium]